MVGKEDVDVGVVGVAIGAQQAQPAMKDERTQHCNRHQQPGWDRCTATTTHFHLRNFIQIFDADLIPGCYDDTGRTRILVAQALAAYAPGFDRAPTVR